MSNLLVIEWDRDRLISTTGSASGKSVTLRQVVVTERENDGLNARELGEKLNASLKSANISAEKAVVVFPRSTVTFRQIQLPHVPDSELPAMIRLQAATRLTVPIESVCLDYTPLPTTSNSESRDVLLVTIPEKNVKQVREALEVAGLELSGLRVSSFGVAASVVHAGIADQTLGADEVEALVWLREDMIEMILLRRQSVLFSHSGASWTSPDRIEQAVRSEISRARLAATEDIGDFTTKQLTLIGSPEILDAVPDSVSQRLNNAEVRRINPDGTLLKANDSEGVTVSELLACSGAIANQQVHTVESVDLVNPRKAPEKKDNRRLKILLYAGASILLLVGGWSYRDNLVRKIEGKTNLATQEANSLRNAYKDAEEELNLDRELTDWTNRDINWLNEIKKINELTGGTDRVLVKSLNCSVRQGNDIGSIRIDGNAKSRRDVEELMRAFDEAGYAVSPIEISDSSRDPSYETEMSLELNIPVPDSTESDATSS